MLNQIFLKNKVRLIIFCAFSNRKECKFKIIVEIRTFATCRKSPIFRKFHFDTPQHPLSLPPGTPSLPPGSLGLTPLLELLSVSQEYYINKVKNSGCSNCICSNCLSQNVYTVAMPDSKCLWGIRYAMLQECLF